MSKNMVCWDRYSSCWNRTVSYYKKEKRCFLLRKHPLHKKKEWKSSFGLLLLLQNPFHFLPTLPVVFFTRIWAEIDCWKENDEGFNNKIHDEGWRCNWSIWYDFRCNVLPVIPSKGFCPYQKYVCLLPLLSSIDVNIRNVLFLLQRRAS